MYASLHITCKHQNEMRKAYKILVGKPDLGADYNILLKWILRKNVRGCGRDSSGTGQESLGGGALVT